MSYHARMRWVASLIFALLGLLIVRNGIRNLAGQLVAIAAIPVDQQAAVANVMGRSRIFTVLAGFSFLIAAALVWIWWPIAIVFAGWPIILFGFCWATGSVDVIRKSSSGDC